MKIPKSILIDPDRNETYGIFAVVVSMLAFAYSPNFGQILILAYYAVWLPLLFVDHRRFTWKLSSAWLPMLLAAYVCFSVFWSQAAGISARAAVQYSSHIICAYVAARTINVRTLVVGSLIGIFFVLLYSLSVGGYALDTIDGTVNFVGAFGSKNQIGFFSSLGIFFCLAFLVFYRRSWLGFVWTAPIMLLSVYMLAIAHSATSVASLPAVIGIVALLTMTKVLSLRYRRVLFIVGAGALVTGIAASLNLGLLDVVLGLLARIRHSPAAPISGSRAGRRRSSTRCLAMAMPLTGCRALPIRSGCGRNSTFRPARASTSTTPMSRRWSRSASSASPCWRWSSCAPSTATFRKWCSATGAPIRWCLPARSD